MYRGFFARWPCMSRLAQSLLFFLRSMAWDMQSTRGDSTPEAEVSTRTGDTTPADITAVMAGMGMVATMVGRAATAVGTGAIGAILATVGVIRTGTDGDSALASAGRIRIFRRTSLGTAMIPPRLTTILHAIIATPASAQRMTTAVTPSVMLRRRRTQFRARPLPRPSR